MTGESVDVEAFPELARFVAAFRDDDNEWWRVSCGDHLNVFEDALDALAAATARAEAAEAREAALRAGARETCREWPDDGDRCDRPAEFILWGKLFPPEALGPRCYDHAVKHTGHNMPRRCDQWAVFDLRALLATGGAK